MCVFTYRYIPQTLNLECTITHSKELLGWMLTGQLLQKRQGIPTLEIL